MGSEEDKRIHLRIDTLKYWGQMPRILQADQEVVAFDKGDTGRLTSASCIVSLHGGMSGMSASKLWGVLEHTGKRLKEIRPSWSLGSEFIARRPQRP